MLFFCTYILSVLWWHRAKIPSSMLSCGTCCLWHLTLQLHGISQPHRKGFKDSFSAYTVGAQSLWNAYVKADQLIALAPCQHQQHRIRITGLKLEELKSRCGAKLHYYLDGHTIDFAPSTRVLSYMSKTHARCKFPYWHNLQISLKDKACVCFFLHDLIHIYIEKNLWYQAVKAQIITWAWG